jgi:hypothetical protein
MPKPLLADFTFEAVAKRKALEQNAAREALVDDVEGSEEDPSLVQATEVPLEDSADKGTAGTSVAYTDVDWWAYVAAVCAYTDRGHADGVVRTLRAGSSDSLKAT